MRLLNVLVLAGLAFGQEEPLPLSVVRGDVIELNGDGTKGEIAVQLADSSVLRCRYDERTYLENNNIRIIISELRLHDYVKVVVDRIRWEDKCYARSVRVTDREPEPPPGRPRQYSLVTEHIVPRGSLTYAGVVIQVTAEQLVLRTRAQVKVTLRLRSDTRFLSEGQRVTSAKLQPNTRVFVRAGRTYGDTAEAYEVTWGTILNGREE